MQPPAVPSIFQELAASISELDVTTGADEQFDSQLLLKITDLPTEDRLGDIEPLGSLAKMKPIGYRY